MSNYNETLTAHNAQIRGLIDKANALPDAGSGGGAVETCTVEVYSNAVFVLYGTNEHGAFVTPGTTDEQGSNTFVGSVLKGSMLAVFQSSLDYNITGEATLLYKAPFPVQFFDITGDCTLSS